MEVLVGILVFCAVAYGLMKLAQSRSRKETDRKGRADKRAKLARDDAKAIQRSLAGRR